MEGAEGEMWETQEREVKTAMHLKIGQNKRPGGCWGGRKRKEGQRGKVRKIPKREG